MHNFTITKKVINKIDKFIKWYLDNFLDLFEDSWIDNIELIEQNYLKTSEEFENKIYDSIENIFWGQKIISYKILQNKNFEITIIIWNYRFFVEYFEDTKQEIRIIKNINIFKK